MCERSQPPATPTWPTSRGSDLVMTTPTTTTSPAVAPLPDFFLLTGFLGSGKTTLVMQLLSDPRYARTGVIVNDVGQLNIDGALIESTDQDLQVVRLTNGCVCCSLMSNLPSTIAALFDENDRRGLPPFERVVFETSGLSRPVPVIKSLMGLPIPFRITVITTYDARHGALASDRYPEAVAQLAAAATIVVTKLDLVDSVALAGAQQRLAALNPLARVLVESDATKRARLAFDSSAAMSLDALKALTEPVEPTSFESDFAHDAARVLLATLRDDLPVDELMEWLEDLAGFCGERLLRCKGLVSLSGSSERLLVQSVGTAFNRPRRVSGSPATASAVVVIVHSLTHADMVNVPGSAVARWSELHRDAKILKLNFNRDKAAA